MPDAVDKVCGWLRQVAAYEKVPRKYHHTMSRAWVELVAHHATVEPFDTFRRAISGPARQAIAQPPLPFHDIGHRAGTTGMDRARHRPVPVVISTP
jgi:hypothetical protein